jgi:hypothetical protein
MACVVIAESSAANGLPSACGALKSVVAVMTNGACTEYFITWLVPRCVAIVVRACCATTDTSTSQSEVVLADLTAAIRTIVQRCNEWLVSDVYFTLLLLQCPFAIYS